MSSVNRATHSGPPGAAGDARLLAFVEQHSGQRIAACYQCGKCAAGCPIASAMDLAPPQILRSLQLGQARVALASRTLWLCVGCQTCVTRCPCQVDLPQVMDALRVWALANDETAAERDVAIFHRVFLKSVEWTGRVYEIGLIAAYNLLSANLFGSADLGLPMLTKGKLKAVPSRVHARADIAGIFARAAELRAKEANAPCATAERGAA
jgi:heterodisulfide reductase subunit C